MSTANSVILDLDTRPDIAIGRCVGALSLADIQNAATTMIERIEAHAAPPRHMLWDLTDATLDLDDPELKRLASFISSRAGEPRGRTAYVASADLAFGLMRVYRAIRHVEDDQINVFRDLGEAEAWLLES